MKQLAFIIARILLVLSIFLLVPLSEKEKEIKVVTFETTMGPIVIELFEEDAPITTKNFLDYANSGFYDGTLFHRVIPGFVIQGGGLEPGMQDKSGNPPIENEANNGQKKLKMEPLHGTYK